MQSNFRFLKESIGIEQCPVVGAVAFVARAHTVVQEPAEWDCVAQEKSSARFESDCQTNQRE